MSSGAATADLYAAVRDRLTRSQADALEEESSVQALLAVMNTRMIEMNLGIADAILTRMQCGTPTVETIESLKGSMDLHLRYSREIERLARFAERMADRK